MLESYFHLEMCWILILNGFAFFVHCYRFFADKSKERSTLSAIVHLPTLEVQGLPEDIRKYSVIFTCAIIFLTVIIVMV